MAITTNGYYNDPALAQAFNNLGSMFKPPSGQELAGYALANERKQQADQLSSLFNYAASSDFNKDVFDRRNAVVNKAPIATGYYGVDAKQRGDTERALLTPIGADAVRYVPQAIADANGVPAVQGGMVKLEQGGQVELPTSLAGLYASTPAPGGPGPDGPAAPPSNVLSGPAKPLTAVEAKGAAFQKLTPDEQRTAVLSDIPTVDVVMGGKPQVAYRSQGVGQTPYSAAAKTETQNYQAPNGGRGTAMFDPGSQRWLDTATHAPIPQGSITFNSSLQGGAADTGLGRQTERDSVIALAGENMAPGIALLNSVYAGDKSLSDPALVAKSLFGENPAVKDIAQRAGIINPDDQEIMGAINSIMNYLYLQTGAARTEKEDERGYAELVPLASDTPRVRQLKHDMFNQKALSIINQAKSPELRDKLLLAMKGTFASPVGSDGSIAPGAVAPPAGRPSTPAAPAAPPGVEMWARGPNGQLVRVGQ